MAYFDSYTRDSAQKFKIERQSIESGRPFPEPANHTTTEMKHSKPLPRLLSRQVMHVPLAPHRLTTEPADPRRPLAVFCPNFLIDAIGGSFGMNENELDELAAVEAEAQQSLDLEALAGLEAFRRDLELIGQAQRGGSTGAYCMSMPAALDHLLSFYWDHHGDSHAVQVGAAKAVLSARKVLQSGGVLGLTSRTQATQQ